MIGNDTWIGYDAVIMTGIHIGEGDKSCRYQRCQAIFNS